ncbi:hypothetical protein ThrDRAFT_03168 [Frankia casuarinae]|nr:hypothetical protein CcI6DRAFT_03752 [Frankia sp. CcI6]EYT91241.1 hypothetical protein ThrDRAFT_03168 [Frankia casuarinae]KFB03365.1 hypothetical protein ALLO2DRAFT_03869 [Frankia sp. Allo2]OAA21493.1 hypothetical protein AAY23_107632 [Frankia casuarinae]
MASGWYVSRWRLGLPLLRDLLTDSDFTLGYAISDLSHCLRVGFLFSMGCCPRYSLPRWAGVAVGGQPPPVVSAGTEMTLTWAVEMVVSPLKVPFWPPPAQVTFQVTVADTGKTPPGSSSESVV